MDKQVRNQMIGAFVWFVVLVALSGYLQPVFYDPLAHVERAYDPDYRSPLARLFSPSANDDPATAEAVAAEEAGAAVAAGAAAAGAAAALQDKSPSADEAVRKETPEARQQEKLTGWILRLASFRQKRQAQQLLNRVRKAGYNARLRSFVNSKGQRWYAVEIVHLKDKAVAVVLKNKLDPRYRIRSEILRAQ